MTALIALTIANIRSYLRNERVLEAVEESAKSRQWVKV